MKNLLLSILLLGVSHAACATQADDITITIDGSLAGATPFLSQVTLSVSDTTAIRSVQFSIAPRPGSKTRPLSGTYAASYLADRGDLLNGKIFLPVYGLYDGYTNTVTLTYLFNDGSSRQDSTTIATDNFDDPCAYENPNIVQPKTEDNSLSYDYILLKGSCSLFSPTIIDTDGALRWVGTADAKFFTLAFFENAIYIAEGALIYRNDLDGTVELLGNFASLGVKNFHHNVDRGKNGLLFEADTNAYLESIIMEIDSAGNLQKTWNMADIISAAMIAGGDDPAQFVFPDPDDWFHSNAVTYNRADDSLIVSSREDFLICIDYTSNAIKWILGDPEKKWYQFASLRQYALTLSAGSLPPIGQHAVSVTHDQGILVLDNGLNSLFQEPAGALRTYAAPRKYQLDLNSRVATEVWNYPMDESLNSPYCGSVYEDLPNNYLVDYAYVIGESGQPLHARLVGLDGTGAKVFDYEYVTAGCTKIFNAAPLHLENTAFPAVGPQSLNISTRGLVASGDGALIAGFIISGNESKSVVLRALGPSLAGTGLSGVLADPAMTLFDATGQMLAMNDDWASDSTASQVAAEGLAPGDPAEAALRVTLPAGAYTAVISGKEAAPAIGLVEVYDVSNASDSSLANMSTRGIVGAGPDDLLISGFILGAVDNSTVVLRALGPSLSAAEISGPVQDPNFTVYDQNGSALGGNDNWRNDPSAFELEQNQLAPPADAEAATILHLPAGAYTAVTAGAENGTGVGLVEVYNLEL
ncbi:MAG: aryl-sulfate sulfotransferase [Verrucomicrobiota bacterium]|nr:aryl-sulfate sulfotransferase [Chthoniobacterales bacterium]MDQ3414281.1 aryl-sulfate sulfotransferase [Verrucomicrobiota bacterium]